MNNRLFGIDGAKFLLILGVVLVHCNIAQEFAPDVVDGSLGLRLVSFISGTLCSMCVPVFFAISAFLFFRNVSSFSVSTYIAKLRSRVTTLLVPYLVWCSVCALLLYVKHRFFHMSGLGVFLDNGDVDWGRLAEGFWGIDDGEGYYPFAFAFWFIRNLMVFIVLSPVAWLLARWNWLAGAFFLMYMLVDVELYGFQWFVAGALMARVAPDLHHVNGRVAAVCAIVYLSMACALLMVEAPIVRNLISLVFFASLGITIYFCGCKLARYGERSLVRTLVASTFMIFAVHQCMCTTVRKLWEHLIGIDSFAAVLATYVASFLTLTCVGIVTYLIIKKISPRLLLLLTGGR